MKTLRYSLAVAVIALPTLALAQPATTPNDAQATPTSPPAGGPRPPESSYPTTKTPPAASPDSGVESRALSPGQGSASDTDTTRVRPKAAPTAPSGTQSGGGK